jgi:hypothetical protein
VLSTRVAELTLRLMCGVALFAFEGLAFEEQRFRMSLTVRACQLTVLRCCRIRRMLKQVLQVDRPVGGHQGCLGFAEQGLCPARPILPELCRRSLCDLPGVALFAFEGLALLIRSSVSHVIAGARVCQAR